MAPLRGIPAVATLLSPLRGSTNERERERLFRAIIEESKEEGRGNLRERSHLREDVVSFKRGGWKRKKEKIEKKRKRCIVFNGGK